jgi:hypothetical protein
MSAADPLPICDDDRDDPAGPRYTVRICPVCERPFAAIGRARYCSRACQQRAYRLRRLPASSELVTGWTAQLRDRGALLAHTVYECPACEQRSLGCRRCDECRLFCRNLGPGGTCASCDDIVTLAEFLGLTDSNHRR